MEKIASQLKQQLQADHLGLTLSEFHGLVTGILCAGNRDASILSLLSIFANNSETLSNSLTQATQQLKTQLLAQLEQNSIELEPFLVAQSIDMAQRVQSLLDWVNHFLLGLGIVQLKLAEFTGQRQEAIQDLSMIAQLKYSEEEIQLAETSSALQEIIEYVVILACYLNNQFSTKETQPLLS